MKQAVRYLVVFLELFVVAVGVYYKADFMFYNILVPGVGKQAARPD